MIKEYLSKVVSGEDMAQSEMEETMNEIMSGEATPAQIAAFITAVRMKGETVEEITGAAKVMREKAIKLDIASQLEDETILDTCGTGGDGTNTFNVSTTAALVAAGGGVRVAKHGNRAVSSKCGSADVLEALGVKLEIGHKNVARCLKEVGIGFLFAPLFHGAMRYAAGPRQEIGIRTIFNLLGPLTNPAGATAQIVGVYDPGLTEKIAQVLGRLGTARAFVVCGEGTFDEISITSPTRLSYLGDGNVHTFFITPEDYGFMRASVDDIKGGGAQKNAEIIRAVLDGEKGPKRDMVLLNAGAAFAAAGLDSDIEKGIQRAMDSIDSGKAKEKLNELIFFTKSCKVS